MRVLCQDVVIFDSRGDLQASRTVQWPASGNGGPTSFGGVIDGGTSQFQSAHGSFQATVLSNGDLESPANSTMAEPSVRPRSH